MIVHRRLHTGDTKGGLDLIVISGENDVYPENMAGDGAGWRLQIWETIIGLGR